MPSKRAMEIAELALPGEFKHAHSIIAGQIDQYVSERMQAQHEATWAAAVEAAGMYFDHKQIEQRHTNSKYPKHAEAYPSWVLRVGEYQRYRDDIRALPCPPMETEGS